MFSFIGIIDLVALLIAGKPSEQFTGFGKWRIISTIDNSSKSVTWKLPIKVDQSF